MRCCRRLPPRRRRARRAAAAAASAVSRVVAASPLTASSRPVIQSCAVCLPAIRCWAAASRSTSSASRPARSMSELSTSSSGYDVAPAVEGALHGGAEQQPVEPVVPAALLDVAELPGGAVVLVEAPADAGADGPVAQPLELVVVEPEPLPYRGGAGEVEHLAGGEPGGAELEQLGEHGEQRVGLAQRAVGEPDTEPGRRVRGVVLGADREGGRDDRGEGLDVRAHDEHVARLEGGVVGEQADDDLAEHLDLPGAAVAGVHLDAAVCAGRAAAGLSGTRSSARSCLRRPSRVSVFAPSRAGRSGCRALTW